MALTRAGAQNVVLHDEMPAVRDKAVSRGAGRAWDGRETARIAVAAVPPRATAAVLQEAQQLGLAQTYTHVCSVQSQVQREVEQLNCDLTTIVGGHPLAGRETSGPEHASWDLFLGRTWALCPSASSRSDAVRDVRALAESCGAIPFEIEADAHDASVALLSHLPQVTASALAGLLVASVDRPRSTRGDATTAEQVSELSGPGLADTTRLAAGNPVLWTEILTANAAHVAPVVRRLASHLMALAGDLDVLASAPSDPETATAATSVHEFLRRGQQGRTLVPVKRGVRSDAFASVAVVVDDRPGRLAALLAAAGEAGVNVEDVRVEHVPGRPRGLIQLLVSTEAAPALAAALAQSGWELASPQM